MPSPSFDADLDALAAARARIDALDAQLLDALALRADATAAVRAAKGPSSGLSYRPVRESAMFARLLTEADPRLSRLTIYALFREIVSASIMTQTPFRIETYGGPQADDIARLEFGAAPQRRSHTDSDAFWRALIDDPNQPHPIGVVAVEGGWPPGAPADAPPVAAAAPLCGNGRPRAFVLAHIQPERAPNSRNLIAARMAPQGPDVVSVGPDLWSAPPTDAPLGAEPPARILGVFAPVAQIAGMQVF